MSRTLSAALVACLLAAPAFADDPAARAVVDKALKALGDDARLAKIKAVTWKGKATFHGVQYTLCWTFQPPERARVEGKTGPAGTELHRITVINGDQGWARSDDNLNELDRETVAEMREGLYAAWVGTVIPLHDKSFTLKLLDEARVDGKAAAGVRVALAGHRDVDLYFDKDSGLLLKSVSQVRDRPGRRERVQEVHYSDYKEFDGVRWATKIRDVTDGNQVGEAEWTDFKVFAKLDESLFARP